MSNRVEGKVAFITGAGRGQGRSHAIRLAEEGADIIAVDVPEKYESLPYSMATWDDLKETARLVEALGRRIIIARADVRDTASLQAAVDQGVSELGRLDIVVANAGISSVQDWDAVSAELWRETLDTNLVGVWNTIVTCLPHLISRGGGSVICTGSTGAVKGLPFLTPYVAAKHGVVGVVRSLANELAQHSIRVNVVHPAGVETVMLEAFRSIGSLSAKDPKLLSIFENALPIDLVEARDVSNAVLFLASDEARYVTGLEFTVDAGNTIR